MSSLSIRQEAAQTDRRRSARFPTEVSVILRTVLGNRKCRISNISDDGAMLETESPPPEGIAACLLMGEDEIFGTIKWSKDGACGIQFERAIGENKLVEIAGEQVQRTGPVANVGNIQPGRKRGRLVQGD